MEINNGDVFDIGLAIDGVWKFLWFNDKWYYFEERITDEYPYGHDNLSQLIIRDELMGFNDVTKLGNILENFK